MAIDDCNNIGEPIDTIYKIDRKKGKITVIKCEEHPPNSCDEISSEECKKGTEEYEEAMKEIEDIKETAEETEKR